MTLGRAGGSRAGGRRQGRSSPQARPGVTCYAGKRGAAKSRAAPPFIYLYNQTIEHGAFLFLQRQTKKKKTVDIEKRPRV